MTKRLYNQNSFLKEFTTDISSVREKENQFHIVLNKTAFYPEGGGQPSDLGFIAQSKVNYVYEMNGEVYHVVNKMPAEKKELNCKIDWQRRFDLMQQHSGQHLLSAVLKSMYQAETVGFHLGANEVTIDIDCKLSDKNYELVEEKVNEIIYQDRKIRAEYPDSEELRLMPLRKKPEVEENIRIVTIEDIDYSPCGGTHLESTGQIGIMSIINTENYKDGMRITFLCGGRSLKDYRYKNKIIAGVRSIFSVKNEDIYSAIKKLKKELDDKENQINNLKDELLAYRVESLIKRAEERAGYRIIKKIYTSENYSDLRFIARKLVEYDNNIVVFGQKSGKTARIILAKSSNINQLNMSDLIKDIMPLLNGNGGGTGYFAQGGGSVSNSEQLTEIIDKAYEKIEDELA